MHRLYASPFGARQLLPIQHQAVHGVTCYVHAGVPPCPYFFPRVLVSDCLLYKSSMYRKLISKEGTQKALPKWAIRAMKNHPSFHGSITRIEAVQKLIESGRSCYLTRYSDYNKFCVISTLTLSYNGELLRHLELEIPQESHQCVYKVSGIDKEFGDISELLEYYQKHPLDQNCLGECLQTEKSIDSVSKPILHNNYLPTKYFP